MNRHDVELQLALVITETAAKELNGEGANDQPAVPADFEDGDQLPGLVFVADDDGDHWSLDADSEIVGGVAFEQGRWVAWHQEHD